jgi:hypothetical protein
MEAVAANKLAREVAHYIEANPRPVELSRRVRHITHGQGLDANDQRQVTRKVRWLLFEKKKRH